MLHELNIEPQDAETLGEGWECLICKDGTDDELIVGYGHTHDFIDPNQPRNFCPVCGTKMKSKYRKKR